MKINARHLVACTSVATLSVLGLLGAVSPVQRQADRQSRFMSEIETVLAMTPTQKDQAQTAIEQAHQAAMPIRQELRVNSRALKSAIRSGETAQIQRLSSTEGQEIGQLIAIRGSAIAKVYKTLTPEQKVKADALQEVLMQEYGTRMERSGSRSAS